MIETKKRSFFFNGTLLAGPSRNKRLERIEQTEAAATLFGSSRMSSESWVVGMPAVLDRLVEVLGKQQYDSCVAIGREMESSNAVYYAREQIRLLRETPATGTKATGVQRAPEQHSC